MKRYYINQKEESNGDQEVHNETCPRLPELANRLDLGEFSSCESAIIAAKRRYSKVDGCYYCSPICHNS